MQIFIDADAIANIAKELIIKTANRTQVCAIFVANRPTRLPPSPFLQSITVSQGFDIADHYIADAVNAGDLVITSDIVLAHDVLERGALVLTARGERLTAENIKPKLNARDFMDMIRGTGVLEPAQMGGQKPYGDKDKIAFANALNQLVKSSKTPPVS
ncbi:YaiI/YqxD family protein [Moraxella marmotae]|uniref:YaiI/YqxD family protein n=1 Tax=Moraxella marmotae TaxID=3344520 RepID=UPI0035F3AD81